MRDGPLRIAVIGAGYFAQFHHQAWAEMPNAELVAIADQDDDKARQSAGRYGAKAVATLSDALQLGIDLVDIATPPTTHFDLIDEATAAGKPTICQKPFCGGLELAVKATELAGRRGVPLIVHENFRFQPWWRKAKAVLDCGDLGDVYDIAFRLRPGDGQGPRAYLDRQPYFQKMPRLLVHETAVHLLDVFRYLMGEPAWVWADLRRLNPVIAGEDAGLIVLGYEDGRRAVFDGNRLSDHVADNRRLVMGDAWVAGANGTLTIDGDGRVFVRAHGNNAAKDMGIQFRTDSFGGGCIPALHEHVVSSLKTGASPENSAHEYLANLRLVDAVYRSAETGERVVFERAGRDAA